MTNHVHLLVTPQTEEGIDKMMQVTVLKQFQLRINCLLTPFLTALNVNERQLLRTIFFPLASNAITRQSKGGSTCSVILVTSM